MVSYEPIAAALRRIVTGPEPPPRPDPFEDAIPYFIDFTRWTILLRMWNTLADRTSNEKEDYIEAISEKLAVDLSTGQMERLLEYLEPEEASSFTAEQALHLLAHLERAQRAIYAEETAVSEEGDGDTAASVNCPDAAAGNSPTAKSGSSE